MKLVFMNHLILSTSDTNPFDTKELSHLTRKIVYLLIDNLLSHLIINI